MWGMELSSRDYLDVGDLAELCVQAGSSEKEGAYNAGSGHGLSINEIVQAIRNVTGSDFKTVYKAARPIDVSRSVLDCSLAKKEFGWKSETQFDSTLQITWEVGLKNHS